MLETIALWDGPRRRETLRRYRHGGELRVFRLAPLDYRGEIPACCRAGPPVEYFSFFQEENIARFRNDAFHGELLAKRKKDAPHDGEEPCPFEAQIFTVPHADPGMFQYPEKDGAPDGAPA